VHCAGKGGVLHLAVVRLAGPVGDQGHAPLPLRSSGFARTGPSGKGRACQRGLRRRDRRGGGAPSCGFGAGP
jgi:hypothetical protein